MIPASWDLVWYGIGESGESDESRRLEAERGRIPSPVSRDGGLSGQGQIQRPSDLGDCWVSVVIAMWSLGMGMEYIRWTGMRVCADGKKT